MATLTFFGWWRPPGAAAVSSGALTAGRLSAALHADRERSRPSVRLRNAHVAYDLFGPGDVTGLAAGRRRPHVSRRPGAQRRDRQGRVRRAGRAGPALAPHRRPAAGQGAAPVDGPAGRHARRDRGRGHDRPAAAVRARCPPAGRLGARRARRAGRRRPRGRPPDLVARARAGPRPRRGDRAGFTAAGAPAWTTPAAGPFELAVYHHWAFHTRAGGDFAALAAPVEAPRAGPDLGVADVEYGPIPAAAAMPVRGALVARVGPAAGPCRRPLRPTSAR